MYGRYVTVAGQQVWVWCCPDTPEAEIIDMASRILEKAKN